MKPRNYYNEFDPKAAAWLRELIAAGLIPPGDVDERSITEVKPNELEKYIQCHFFAGVAGWSLALQLAGWPTTRPVWTGSCPCQPFSSAGKQRGVKDERHLWPVFFKLIEACKPSVVFGEQVASAEVVGSKLEAAFLVAVREGEYARANKIAHQLVRSTSFHYFKRWLDGVQSDLESANYTFGTSIVGAHSVSAPHIRQRLYWLAYATQRGVNGVGGYTGSTGSTGHESEQQSDKRSQPRHGCQDAEWVGESEQPRLEGHAGDGGGRVAVSESDGGIGEVRNICEADGRSECGQVPISGGTSKAQPNFWRDAIWLPCRDGKARRVPQSGLRLLVAGLPRGVVPSGDPSEQEAQNSAEARVMRLRGYGNSIVPQVAAEFIKAYLNK